jgi:PAS domain S-box-containing protein
VPEILLTDAIIPTSIPPETICPVTGLTVTARPEWTDRQSGSGYRLTTRVIGDRIILNQPSGHAQLSDIVDSLQVTDAIVQEHIDASAGYVHLSDYAGMRSITREARKHYIRHMSRREKMIGLICYGVDPLSATMIKLAKRINNVRFKVLIVADYRAAVLAATRLLGIDSTAGESIESANQPRDSDISEHYENGRHTLRCDQWRLERDGYRLTVEVIDRRIYHARSSGTLRAHHIEAVDRLRERVRRVLGLEQGFAAIVTGTAGGHSSDYQARRQYMASLKRWHRRYPMPLYVFYNANRFIRTAAMLSVAFMPFKVKVAQDLTSALALVDRFMTSSTVRSAVKSSSPNAATDDSAQVVQQLLQFIGDIDWERDGAPVSVDVDTASPFRPVFDAIALIKDELDEVLDARRRIESELRESQVRFEEVMKHSRDILFKRDITTGGYAYISDAATRLLGVNPQAIRRMGFGGVKAMVHPDDLPGFMTFNQNLLKTPHDENVDHVIEYRMRDSQGNYRWFSDSHAIVRDAHGQPAFVIGGNRDINAQKVAEQDLKSAYQRFTTVLDSISAHIYVADMDSHNILFMNRSMRDDFGDDHIGERCYRVFRGSDEVCPHCTNHKLVDADGQPTGVHTWECFNPVLNRWFLNHDQAIRWVDGRLVRLQIATDISKIKALESERQAVADRLQHTRKLEAVSTFAGGVAHNFNNLLMVVLGNLELMRLDAEEGDSLSRKIDAAEKSAQRAADMSTLMLTYVGQTRISPQQVDLNATADEMVDVLATTVAESASLRFTPSDGDALIHADASKVCQVITNLITNAVEASGDDPLDIRLSVGHQHCDTAQLFRLAPGEGLPEGTYVWLRVADNGRGMDQETLEKVFDPFFTTKFTGRGLGMAAVMGIMRAHRGGVRIDSRPDAGTTVTIYFPEYKPAAAAVAPSIGKTQASRHRGTALLVDDEPLVLELGKQMLEMLGFDVLPANDGVEAMAVCEANRDRIRLAVLDINMPRMGGRETVERLHGMVPDLPVLVASGFTESQAREKLGDAPVAGFIKKPFRIEQLRETIETIFRAAPD